LEGFTEAEVISVDCDENEDLVDKYEVRGLPTLVLIDDNEKVISKFVGMTKPEVLKDAINNYEINKA
jgi:thiol-disulfide isomerase/thioredoxin